MNLQLAKQKIDDYFESGKFEIYLKDYIQKESFNTERYIKINNLSDKNFDKFIYKVIKNPYSNLARLFMNTAKNLGTNLLEEDLSDYPASKSYSFRGYSYQEWFGPLTITPIIQKIK